MDQAAEFDAFYKSARTRLLLQTYALTGDLPASRSAVRDSFVVTWHHWRKVSRLPDPESWVRPHAWSRAQRRHTARIWHRDKNLDPEAAATLDALGKLTFVQRKALLLDELTSLPLEERARELGMTRQEAERHTRTASARFSVYRDVASPEFPGLFETLHRQVAAAGWPRPTILRRAGAARRRTHTLAGALAGVAAVLVTGPLVQGSGTGEVAGPRDPGSPDATVTASEETPQFDAGSLVAADSLALAVDGRRWRDTGTSDNTEGTGRVTSCQERRYADPRARAALVRSFQTSPQRNQQRVSAVQVAELSANLRAARRAWQQAVAWYAGCTAPQVQLQATREVRHAGDQAVLVQLRDWREDMTYLAGVARTGRITTTTVYRTTDTGSPDVEGATDLLALAVNRMCRTPQGASCATNAEVAPRSPLPVGDVPALLATVDLPPVPGVRQPWVGTEPREARDNVAATNCDRTDFAGRPVRNGVTRTFLVPQARLPATFGITETAGSLPSVAQARSFVAEIRREMSSCPDRDPGVSVASLASASGSDREHALWRVTMEINDRATVTLLMGVVREGSRVAQIGFVPARSTTLAPRDLTGLLVRAGQRLRYLPAAGGS
jgi:hypothetical protein